MGLYRSQRMFDDGGEVGTSKGLSRSVALTIDAPLTHKLPDDWSISRSTTATVEDFEGLIKTVNANEARFKGARRVENLLTETENFYSSIWVPVNMTITSNQMASPFGDITADKLVGSVSGAKVYFNAGGSPTKPANYNSFVGSVYLYTEESTSVSLNIFAWGGSESSYNIAIPAMTWTRFSALKTFTGDTGYVGIAIVTNAETVYAWGAQLEDVTGQTNQNPSEYVSVGVESSPYHGAGVDGVKYFNYENGNTVSNNVVTEARGSDISASTLKGLMIEGSRTNLVLWSEDFSNAAWQKASGRVEVLQNQLTAPNGTNTAQVLRAVTGSSTGEQYTRQSCSITGDICKSIYIKKYNWRYICLRISNFRIFDFDTESFTFGEQTGDRIEVLANGWYRIILCESVTSSFYATIGTASNATTVSWTTAPNNNEGVYAWEAQVEQASFASSYIKTEASTVTRVGDDITFPSTKIDGTKGAIYTEFTTQWTDAIDAECRFLSSTSNDSVLNIDTSRQARLSDGTNWAGDNTITGVTSLQKIACSWGNSGLDLYLSGTAGTSGSFDGGMNFGSTIYLGNRSAGDRAFFGTFKNLKIWARKVSDNYLEAITT